MIVQPYLNFDGRCDEALEFYKKAVGAEVKMVMRFKDSPDPKACAGAAADKVMHSTLQIGESEFFATDGENSGKKKFEGFSLSLSVKTKADAERVFAALSAGGQVKMPLTETFFAHSFGMVADKFGLSWMILVHR